MVWIVLGVILGIAGLMIRGDELKAYAKRQLVLRRAAKLLGGEHDRVGSAHGGGLGGDVVLRVDKRGPLHNQVPFTEMAIEFPEDLPMVLHVFRRDLADPPDVERGETVDVDLGDEEFSSSFVVEAAPAEVVRLLIDEDARTFLLWADTVELELDQRKPRALRLTFSRWLEAEEETRRGAELLVRIAHGAAAAFERVERGDKPELSGDPYRPIIDHSAAREAAAGREEELERVRRTRALRKRR